MPAVLGITPQYATEWWGTCTVGGIGGIWQTGGVADTKYKAFQEFWQKTRSKPYHFAFMLPVTRQVKPSISSLSLDSITVESGLMGFVLTGLVVFDDVNKVIRGVPYEKMWSTGYRDDILSINCRKLEKTPEKISIAFNLNRPSALKSFAISTLLGIKQDPIVAKMHTDDELKRYNEAHEASNSLIDHVYRFLNGVLSRRDP